MMEFINDICTQHNWLAENVIQLVEELDKSKIQEETIRVLNHQIKENNQGSKYLNQIDQLSEKLKESEFKCT